MAVERLTDYTRRIWTALGPDAPEGHDIHVNDVIYFMDSSECCIVTNVYPDGSIDCETLPDVGGGGGVAYTPVTFNAHNNRTSNITAYYTRAVDNLDGYLFGTTQSMAANGTASFNTVAQNGYITFRANYDIRPITYNGEVLDVIYQNPFLLIPYVGSDHPYEFYDHQ